MDGCAVTHVPIGPFSIFVGDTPPICANPDGSMHRIRHKVVYDETKKPSTLAAYDAANEQLKRVIVTHSNLLGDIAAIVASYWAMETPGTEQLHGSILRCTTFDISQVRVYYSQTGALGIQFVDAVSPTPSSTRIHLPVLHSHMSKEVMDFYMDILRCSVKKVTGVHSIELCNTNPDNEIMHIYRGADGTTRMRWVRPPDVTATRRFGTSHSMFII